MYPSGVVAGQGDDFRSIEVGGDLFLAAAHEAQLRSQGVRVTRLDPDIESPAPCFPYRLLVPAEHVPLALELLTELAENPAI